MDTSYLDFELEIGEGQGREYPMHVVHSPAGEVRATLRFPFDDILLQNRLLSVENAVLRSGGQRRQTLSPDELAVQEFGRELFDILFPPDVRSLYFESLSRATTQEKGLRLKLRLGSARLAALPWEFLFDARHSEYLALSSKTPIVRYIERPQAPVPLPVTLPLRILGMEIQLSDQAGLDMARERERIHLALRDLERDGAVEVTWLEGRNWRDLQRAMRRGPWHIFHFAGHGGFDPNADEGVLLFAREDGGSRPLRATEVGRLLADHSHLRLVVLNACEAARGSQQDIFSSTASILVRRGLPAVLAMQYAISDRAAIEFSRSFYEAIADGLPVDAAVAEARKSVSFEAAPTVEWGTPVLYMRALDGRLFTVEPSSAPAAPAPPPSAPVAAAPSAAAASTEAAAPATAETERAEPPPPKEPEAQTSAPKAARSAEPTRIEPVPAPKPRSRPLRPSVAATLSSAPPTAAAGESVMWELRVANDGQDDLKEVTVWQGASVVYGPFDLPAGRDQVFTSTTTYRVAGAKTKRVRITAKAERGREVREVSCEAFGALEVRAPEPARAVREAPSAAASAPKPASSRAEPAPQPESFREQLKAWVRANDPDALLPCPICGHQVKAGNLVQHYDRLHPGQEGQIPSAASRARATKPTTDRSTGTQARPTAPDAAVAEPQAPREAVKALARANDPETLLRCPVCNYPIKAKRLVMHYDREHGAPGSGLQAQSSTSRAGSPPGRMITPPKPTASAGLGDRLLSWLRAGKPNAQPGTQTPEPRLTSLSARAKPASTASASPTTFRDELKELARGVDPESPLMCPVCGVEVKARNLVQHYDRNHA